MTGTGGKETPQGRPSLHTVKREVGKPHSKRNEQVNAEANSRHARAEQPETLAETFAPGGLDTPRRPQRTCQELQHQEEQRGSNIYPTGEKCGSNQCAKTAQRVEHHTLYHAAPVTDFVKHHM